MITAIIDAGQHYCQAVSDLWQWDYGQTLRIQGVKLPAAVEVQFSTTERIGETVTRIGVTQEGVTEVPIPDTLLEGGGTTQDYTIYAFVYIENGDSGKTEYRVSMKVRARPKPEAHATPEEGELFRQAIVAVAESADRAESARKSAETAADQAENAKKAAEEAKAAADADKEAAEAAQAKAEAAQKAAENAETEAKKAQTATETAKTAVETMQSTAAGYAYNANVAKESAETARSEAETAKNDAVQAKDAAEKAKSGTAADREVAEAASKAAQVSAVSAEKSAERAGTAKEEIQESADQIQKNATEIDSLKEDISKYKKTLKSSDLEWSNATCYNGILSSDATILTSEIFSLKKGDAIYFDNENIRTRITTYNADGTYKSNTGNYVHFDTYNITNDGLLYRISIGVLNGDLSNNASLIKYVRFSEAYVYEKYTPSEKFENDMYNHKKIKPTWTQGSVYQGKIDSSILANISSELFYAPKGTKIIIPSGYQVRISFFDESGTFLNSYGYAYYQQYILFEDSYIRLSLYDGTNPMDISKGNNVQIVKDEFESLSRVSKLEEKTTSLEKKTTSLEKKTTSLEKKTTSLEENVLGYTGSKISVVENTMIFRKKISYSKTKWGENTWSGGLAIYNNMAIVGYNMGYLALFDICQNKLIATGKSTIFGTNHANNLSFDYENIVNDFPVMYLTRASVGYSECYVESLKVESDNLITNLVQTISYNGQYLDNIHDVNWCIDRSSNELVAIIYETSEKVNILKFKKPLLDNGDITFTDNDIIKVISSNNISALQGSDIANGKLFITDGYSNGFLKVISLESGELINSIPLSSASQAEPEGICIYENKIYVNFHEKNDIECLLYEFIV